MKTIAKKALSCLVVIGFLMSAVLVLVVDINAQQQEENTWIEIVQAPNDIASGGDVVFHGNALYIMAGGGSKDLWKLDLDSGSWTTLQSLPEGINWGANMAFDGKRYIYVIKGSTSLGLVTSKKFWRYNIDSNIWETLTDTPKGVGPCGSICYANGYVYLRPGTCFSSSFYRYSTSSQIWETMASGPCVAITAGPNAAMTYDGSQYIYTFQGGQNMANFKYDNLWRYDTLNNQWKDLGRDTREELDRADLVYVDGGLYALSEYGMINFRFFDLSTNTWSGKPDVPCGFGIWNSIGPGASLAYDGVQYIYALKGGKDRRICRYCIGYKPIDFNIDVTSEKEWYDPSPPVPYFCQCNPKWAIDHLGHKPGCPNICAAGCALTSAAMVMAYYGVDTDPGRLNALIGSDGYVGCNLTWNVVANKYRTDQNQIKYHPELTSYDETVLNEQLDAKHPVIVDVGGHFVVVTSRSGNTYYVSDPIAGRKTLDDYPNRNGLRIFTGNRTAKVTIDVTNNRDEDTEIWLGVTFQDPKGNEYDISLTQAEILKGETKSFDIDWAIPDNVPLGQYGIAVNCWKDVGQNEKYTDDLEWEPIFYTYNLDITSPTNSNPTLVGDPSNPAEFNAKVSTGLGELGVCLLHSVFEVKIDDKPAKFQIYEIDLNGNYYFKITPPVQDAEGSYDLNISVNAGEISDYDIENAVIYSTGGNIDVVEVIDRSGSMSGEKIQAAKDSAKLFVDLMKINDIIGVASYSNSASVNYGLTKITSDTTKQNAKNAIGRISAGGMTSIGAGLRAAYNELVNKGDPSHPHSIVLMSDGWHNTAPHPDTVLPDIRNANIRVFTIGLGAGADASLLSHIAHDSGGGGGEYYYSPGSQELSAIYSAIAGVVKAESTVKTVTGSIKQGETITHKVDIDPTINIATFTVTWTSGTLNFELKRPDGSKIDPSNPGVSHTKEATYEIYTVDNPMVGEWTMEITATSSSSSSTGTTAVTLTNTGEIVSSSANNTIDDNWSTEKDVPAKMPAKIGFAQNAVAQAGISYTATVTATTNLTMHIYLDKDKYSLNEPMKIITTLTKAGNPITEADVNAIIKRPDGAKDYLLLYDDGKHGDGAALDGVYANYYTNTDVAGSYTITVYASGTASPEEFTREVKKSVYVSGAPAGEISVTPTSWNVKTFKGVPTEYAVSDFATNSASTRDETVLISATDLTDAYGNIGIEVDSISNMPSTFQIPAKGSGVFYTKMDIPEDTNPGKYTGSLVLTSTANSVSIPVSLDVIVPTGGFSAAIRPKINSATAAEACDFTVRLRNTQNFDEDVALDLTLSGIPAQYTADPAWFNWTTSALSIPAGEYRDIGLRMDIPEGISGYKSFGIVAHGTFGDSKDYGVADVISAP